MGDNETYERSTTAVHMQLLIVVKAYPALSRRSGEVDCVAAIRLDVRPRQWVRLFPVPYRDLPDERRFKKWQVVELRASRPRNDPRPESWQPDIDSIVLGREITTSEGWGERLAVLEPMLSRSMCGIQRLNTEAGVSLGAFRPAEVIDVRHEDDPDEWSEEARIAAARRRQHDPLFGEPSRPVAELEHLPVRFKLRYRCSDTECRTHEQTIIDWEIGEAYRARRDEAGDARAREIVRDRWLKYVCGPTRDPIVLVGDQHQHRGSFLVLGIAWPPRGPVSQMLDL